MKRSVWWPGVSKQLADLVQTCDVCIKQRRNKAEPMIASPTPERPWQRVGTDLFQWENKQYVLVVDYFSRYIEIALLKETSSDAVINHLKSIFARHGIPEVVISDNGPQYASSSFAKFAEKYGFEHITSSPRFPQSNGEAERAVQTIKGLLSKAKDPYLALLAYRSTPLATGQTPAQLLMGRQLRTTLPSHPSQLAPEWPDIEQFRAQDKQYRAQQSSNYNRRHRVTTLPDLKTGERVWHRELHQPATIIREAGTPRSYILSTPRGMLRRNRRVLVPRHRAWEHPNDEPPEFPSREQEVEPLPEPPRSPPGRGYRTASGRIS